MTSQTQMTISQVPTHDRYLLRSKAIPKSIKDFSQSLLPTSHCDACHSKTKAILYLSQCSLPSFIGKIPTQPVNTSDTVVEVPIGPVSSRTSKTFSGWNSNFRNCERPSPINFRRFTGATLVQRDWCWRVDQYWVHVPWDLWRLRRAVNSRGWEQDPRGSFRSVLWFFERSTAQWASRGHGYFLL